MAAMLLTSVPVAAGPAAAQAGSSNPVHALERQMRGGHGVRTAETVRVAFGGKDGGGYRINGKVRLGRSGAAAVDFTWRDIPRPGAGHGIGAAKTARKPTRSYRTIRVGVDVYCDSRQYVVPIPDGTKWIRKNHRAGLCWTMARAAGLQPIDVYDPALLRAVLRRSTRTPVPGGFRYQGTLTYKRLSQIAKGHVDPLTNTRVTAKSKGTISWRLWTRRDGLPERLITVDAPGGANTSVVMRAETRYTQWGRPLAITAPPAHQVTDEDDLGHPVPDPEPTQAAAD